MNSPELITLTQKDELLDILQATAESYVLQRRIGDMNATNFVSRIVARASQDDRVYLDEQRKRLWMQRNDTIYDMRYLGGRIRQLSDKTVEQGYVRTDS